MATSFDSPLICPVLIGRNPQRDSIRRVLDETRGGKGRTVCISGDAGIGKSRLVAEARQSAERAGLLVLQGSCFERDRSLAFAPLLDLIRINFASNASQERTRSFGPASPEFVRIVSELGIVLDGLKPTPAHERELDQRRLFHTISQWFNHLATEKTLLLIFEDLHWSDDTSLDLVRYLARDLAMRPVLVLLTYRTDEAQPSLRHVLAALDRERLMSEMRLAPLSIDDVDEMIRALFDLHSPVPAEFLNIIYGLTEGNPFFVEELLRSLVTAGDIFSTAGIWSRKPLDQLRVPRTISDAVQRRSQQLSQRARQTLVLAAVAGRRFDFPLLQVLTGSEEPELLEAIEEMVAAQLVVEESADRFAFRHALTHQAIYSEILAHRRKALHGQIAETIERRSVDAPEAPVSDLAFHFREAGQPEKVLVYAQLAGERARALFAPRSAVEQLSFALEAARQLGVTVPARTLHERGLAYDTLGEFDHAQADLVAALGLASSAPDRSVEWKILLDLGFHWVGRDYARAGEYFRQALALAREVGKPRMLAQSLNRIGNWSVNIGDAASGLRAHHDALDISEAEMDVTGTAETLDLLGMAYGIAGDILSCVHYYDRSIELLRSLGNATDLLSSLASRALYASPALVETTASALGTTEGCDLATTEALSLSRQVHLLAGRAYALWTGGVECAGFGAFGPGLAQAHEALRISTEIEHQQWQAASYFALGQAYVFMLDSRGAIAALESGLPLARELGSAWWIGNISASLAIARILSGELSQAEAILTATMPREQTPRNLPDRRMAWAWGELGLAVGDPEFAIRRADELIASAPGPGDGQPIPALLRLKGAAHLALGRPDEAVPVLEAAKRGALERQARPLAWQIHQLLGQAYRLSGREQLAELEFATARGIAEGLAHSLDDPVLRERFRRVALGDPPKPAISPRRAEAEKFQGLTAREREVATQIAQGGSNRVIAERLFVGERTIEAHVSSILSKLDYTSRTQIAAWAIRRGLAGPTDETD